MVEPPETSPDRPRRRALAALLVVFVLVASAAIAAVSYVRWCEGASGPREPVTLVVPEGASAADVVDLLHGSGVIRCGAVSRLAVRGDERADAILAGERELTTNMTLDEAIAVLAAPPPPAPTVTLTIPEGLRLTEIADRVAELGVPRSRFLSVAESGDHVLAPYLPRGAGTTEGFLFPKTYEFRAEGLTARAVVDRLLAQFADEVADLPWHRAEELGLSPYEVVIVASMIEGEAKIEDERPLIAAVIYNRLREGMTLGIDATLRYVDPNPEDGLTESDLEIDSPYNTRKYRGLPPTPINSPRLASIRAALQPADVSYRYYVLCGRGGQHRFSETYATFLADKAECLG
jgi:UPF0755 protein